MKVNSISRYRSTSRTSPPPAAPCSSTSGSARRWRRTGSRRWPVMTPSMNVVFLRRDLPTLPEDQRDIHAIGLILAFSVDDLDYPVAEHGPLTVGVEHDVAVLAAQLLRGAGGLSQMGQRTWCDWSIRRGCSQTPRPFSRAIRAAWVSRDTSVPTG